MDDGVVGVLGSRGLGGFIVLLFTSMSMVKKGKTILEGSLLV